MGNINFKREINRGGWTIRLFTLRTSTLLNDPFYRRLGAWRTLRLLGLRIAIRHY